MENNNERPVTSFKTVMLVAVVCGVLMALVQALPT